MSEDRKAFTTEPTERTEVGEQKSALWALW